MIQREKVMLAAEQNLLTFFVRQLGQLVCGQKVDLITFRFGDEVPLSRCQLIELLVRDKKDRKKMCHFASAGHYGN